MGGNETDISKCYMLWSPLIFLATIILLIFYNYMKVSIITSSYNREKTIRGCIESVLAQDYPDIEYIVVDGASKDGSLSIINEYKDRISKIISEPDHGMYEAINKGIRAATGDVIGLVHSDDFLYSPQTVSNIVSVLRKLMPIFCMVTDCL